MPERILLLGSTGVAKGEVVTNLNKYAQTQSFPVDFLHIDFEKDCIREKRPLLKMHNYLDADRDRQKLYWQQGWECVEPKCQDNSDKHILLSLHGVLTRLATGTRSPLDLNSIFNFSPTKIITLIDDVYSKWYRTEKRAVGAPYKGTPTLEQLLDARRKEIFLGDLIAHNISPSVRHYIFSVCHPARTLYRLLFLNDTEIIPVYLSFPISGPRELLDEGDDSGIREINEFLQKASYYESQNSKAVFFCPLCIDELPLLKADKVEKDGDDYRVFKLHNRWSTTGFYGDEILLTDHSAFPEEIVIPGEQVEHAAGFIKRDVALRDYKLIEQSDQLAIFNPWFKGKETSGVRNEIKVASFNDIPCRIYQDPEHDPEGEAEEKFKPTPGSLGEAPGSPYIILHKSVEEMFETMLNSK